MAELRIALLGSPQLTLGETEINGRLPAKAQMMLCYLVCASQIQPRSRLTGLLWGDKPEADARRSLRVDLSKMRRILPDYLIADRASITFNREADYWLDVESFEYTLKRADGVAGAAQRAILRDAVALYRGDFLEGAAIDGESIYEEWILPERERLRQLVLNALDRLIAICIEQGDNEAGIQYAQRLLRLDEWREDAHRQLMRMYARSGQRMLALRQFEICRDVLEREFSVPPAAATLALYEQTLDMEEGQVLQPLAPLLDETDAPPFLAPKLIPHFTGRAADLARLRAKLLQRGKRRVYSLFGMPGIGKSAMAIETAHALRDAFPDGVLWANAATDDPKSVAERWANAYGFDFSRIPDLDERAAVLRDLLKEKQVLLIFDDVTGSAWVRSFIPDSHWCAVLLTMRNANLARVLKAEVIEVAGLSPEDGRSLLADILTEERVAAEEETAAAIYRLLQGLPLALSLAAQRLAALPRRKLSWLVERLQVGLAEHGQAVKTSFEIGWEGLDESHQQIFAYLAVFAGRDFHVDALAAVAGLKQFPAYDRLDMLVTLSLLNEQEDGRYRQHALLTLFAKEKLGEDDTPLRRMIAYYHAFAHDNREDYAALGPEWENLSASIAQAHEMALWPTVIAFTQALRQAWFTRGRHNEARLALSQGVGAAKAIGDKQALTQCLLDWGYICLEQNDYDEAQRLLLNGLKLLGTLDNQAGIADAFLWLSSIAKARAEYDEAAQWLVKCRRLHEYLGDEKGIAETLYMESSLRFSRGDYVEANTLAQQALKRQEELQDKLGLVRTLRLLTSIVDILEENNDLAKQYNQQARRLAKDLENQVEMAAVLMDLAGVYARDGDFLKAEEFALASLEMRRNLGDRRGQAMIFFQLSWFNLQQEDHDAALKYGQRSLEMCRALDDKSGIAFSLQRVGDIYQAINQMERACMIWHEALLIAQDIQQARLLDTLPKRLKKYCPTAKGLE